MRCGPSNYKGAELGKSNSMRQGEGDKPLVEALSGGVLSWSASPFMAERRGWATWVVVSEVDSGMVASERDAALDCRQTVLYLFRWASTRRERGGMRDDRRWAG